MSEVQHKHQLTVIHLHVLEKLFYNERLLYELLRSRTDKRRKDHDSQRDAEMEEGNFKIKHLHVLTH